MSSQSIARFLSTGTDDEGRLRVLVGFRVTLTSGKSLVDSGDLGTTLVDNADGLLQFFDYRRDTSAGHRTLEVIVTDIAGRRILFQTGDGRLRRQARESIAVSQLFFSLPESFRADATKEPTKLVFDFAGSQPGLAHQTRDSVSPHCGPTRIELRISKVMKLAVILRHPVDAVARFMNRRNLLAQLRIVQRQPRRSTPASRLIAARAAPQHLAHHLRRKPSTLGLARRHERVDPFDPCVPALESRAVALSDRSRSACSGRTSSPLRSRSDPAGPWALNALPCGSALACMWVRITAAPWSGSSASRPTRFTRVEIDCFDMLNSRARSTTRRPLAYSSKISLPELRRIRRPGLSTHCGLLPLSIKRRV
jgi:hypothetical protein